MSQVEVKEAGVGEAPIEVLVKEVNELLKRYELRGETRMMNKSAVARLCGAIESRRISKAKQIESVAKATGRYPYVVFAFRRERNAVCIPDGNYYVADGMYDVHIIDCDGDNGARCAEVAANVADIFDFPISREALLMLADEVELCGHNVLPCRRRGERAEEQPEAEEPEAPPVERREAGDVEVPAVVNKIKDMLLAMKDSMRQQPPAEQRPAPVAPARPSPPAPQQPPPAERPDPKSVLKEFGLGWLAPVVDDPAAAAALRFIMENRDILDALKSEEKRKMVVQAVKEGGVPAAPSAAPSALDKVLERWLPKDRERLMSLLAKSRDLYSLASALIQYLTGDANCAFDVVKEIMDLAAERGLTCEAMANAMSR
jgi:hypothetical protein